MRNRGTITSRLTVSADILEELSFVLYLCIPLLTSTINFILSSVGIARTSAIIVAYAPYNTHCKEKKNDGGLFSSFLFHYYFFL